MAYSAPRAPLGLGLALALGCSVANPAFTIGPPTGGDDASGTDGATSTTGATDSITGEDSTGAPGDTDVTTDPSLTTGTTDPAAVCGDGEKDPGEDCDDGNAVPGDGCESDCTQTPPPPKCGDGVLDLDEQCDDGNGSDGDACLSNCFANVCGDGFVHDGVEACDDANDDDGDDCLGTCVAAACGDGVVHAGVEECDDANNVETDACLPGCKAAHCGDGIIQQGVEECDDSNDVDNDSCTNECHFNQCGDGQFQFETEQCDETAQLFADLPEGVCTGCKLTGLCFLRTNTQEVDFDENANEHYTWFEDCQAAPGNKVHVLIVNATQRVFYGSGAKTKMWSDGVLTSEAMAPDQWNTTKHQPILMNGGADRLFLFARNAKPNDPLDMNCLTRLGDGYGLAIIAAGKLVPRLTFMPYKGGGTNTARTFPMWAPDRELAFTDGATPLCQPAGSLKPLLNHRIALMITP